MYSTTHYPEIYRTLTSVADIPGAWFLVCSLTTVVNPTKKCAAVNALLHQHLHVYTTLLKSISGGRIKRKRQTDNITQKYIRRKKEKETN